MSTLSPALALWGADPGQDADERLATAIRAVLETRPGRVPWCPDFGCDLERYLGMPLSPQVLAEVRWRVTEALQRWVPGLTIAAMEVEAVVLEEGRISMSGGAPLAEAALLGLGTQAALSLRIEVHTPSGPRSVRTLLSP